MLFAMALVGLGANILLHGNMKTKIAAGSEPWHSVLILPTKISQSQFCCNQVQFELLEYKFKYTRDK